jgi:signal transduction histidine kinase
MASEASAAGDTHQQGGRANVDLEQELAEAHRREAATAEVLKALSRSTFNLQDVLDSLVKSAVQLTGAETGLISRQDGEVYRAVAIYDPYPEFIEIAKQNPIPLDRQSTTGRAVLERRVVHIHDVLDDPEYTWVGGKATGIRTLLAVPMLREDTVVGVITCGRREARPFTAKQIELVQTFADQAVIAIENTRLFEAEQASKRELQESLQYQTATSEVLSVISRSPNELQPVLDTILETAQQLCQSDRAQFFLLENGAYHLAAHKGTDPEFVNFLRDNPISAEAGTPSPAGRAARERGTIHVPDVAADTEVARWHLERGAKGKSILVVPLIRDGLAIGVITLAQMSVRPFTERQIELVKVFADQAVIAIENTRLFEEVQARTRELTESLEQQTATADVLKVISRSALDLRRALDALVESAARLCNAYDAVIFHVFGDGMRLVAHHGQIPLAGPLQQHTVPLVPGLIAARAIIDRRTIHVADALLADADGFPESRKNALQQGFRTVLAVPLVHAGEAIGVILIRRAEVRPFTERQIELVNTFADQAVIAIENTRLFEEVQARTRELAKTVEDLEIASQHKNQFVANMSHELRTPLAAILGYAELIQEGFYEPQGPKSLAALTRIRSNGKHLLGLINTVLDIAKIESGQFSLNLGEYALENVVETVRAATEALAESKKLGLKTAVAKPLPIGLGDEQRLTQVLLNLVGNAIKFTDAGEICITATASDGHFALSVTDTGPGIPQEHQARIFEQFHQVDSSNTKAKGGTGLGLAIAKQIVEMHGGRIWVESTLGKGATFQMELPTRAEHRKSAP